MMATKLIQNILKMSQAIKKVPNFLDQNSVPLSWKKQEPSKNNSKTEESKKRTNENLKTPESKKKKLNQKNKKKDGKKKK
jgi:hypothetical protein